MRKVAVYAGTRNLYDTMRVALNSLLANNTMDQVYLLIEDDVFPYPLPSETVTVVNVGLQKIFPPTGANHASRWTYMTMMRCALGKIIDEDLVLWLDCDTIVDGDISRLFEFDMSGYYYAGVMEFRKGEYINTGVLLINLAEIRKDGFEDRLIERLNTEKFELPDQDAINLVARGRIKFLDSRYNVCPFTEMPEEMVIYHYAGRVRYDNDPLYRKYAGGKLKTRTLIAIPCFDMVHTDFMRSFIDMEKGDACYTVIKNSLIYNARNMIAEESIRHGFDRVMWLDSDIICQPDTLVRLSEDMDTGLDFVSGLYFMRTEDTKPVLFQDIVYDVKDHEAHTGARVYLDYPKNQLFEVAGAGFGCCMTTTELLKKLLDKYGQPFTPMMGLGEDVAFCYRAKQTGAKLWADSRVRVGHIGQKVFDERAYDGSK